MPFAKQDLNFIHYRWALEDEPASILYQGEPSRRIFDPFNGNQVLFLINACDTAWGSLSLKEVRQLESKIAHQLPSDIKSERSVFNWIKQNIKNWIETSS